HEFPPAGAAARGKRREGPGQGQGAKRGDAQRRRDAGPEDPVKVFAGVPEPRLRVPEPPTDQGGERQPCEHVNPDPHGGNLPECRSPHGFSGQTHRAVTVDPMGNCLSSLSDSGARRTFAVSTVLFPSCRSAGGMSSACNTPLNVRFGKAATRRSTSSRLSLAARTASSSRPTSASAKSTTACQSPSRFAPP